MENRVTTKKTLVVVSDSSSEPIVKDALAKEPQAESGKWKVVESDPKPIEGVHVPVEGHRLVPTLATMKDEVEDSTAASKGHSSVPSGEDSGLVGSGNAQSDVREEIAEAAEAVAVGGKGGGDQPGTLTWQKRVFMQFTKVCRHRHPPSFGSPAAFPSRPERKKLLPHPTNLHRVK